MCFVYPTASTGFHSTASLGKSTFLQRAQTSKAKWERREQGWGQRIRGLQMLIISLLRFETELNDTLKHA